LAMRKFSTETRASTRSQQDEAFQRPRREIKPASKLGNGVCRTAKLFTLVPTANAIEIKQQRMVMRVVRVAPACLSCHLATLPLTHSHTHPSVAHGR